MGKNVENERKRSRENVVEGARENGVNNGFTRVKLKVWRERKRVFWLDLHNAVVNQGCFVGQMPIFDFLALISRSFFLRITLHI